MATGGARTRLTIRVPAGIELVVETVDGGTGEPVPGPCESVTEDVVAGGEFKRARKLMLMTGISGNYRWNAAGCRGTGGPNGFCRNP
jgi:hypothetical protein